jgi:hypothetical protein
MVTHFADGATPALTMQSQAHIVCSARPAACVVRSRFERGRGGLQAEAADLSKGRKDIVQDTRRTR